MMKRSMKILIVVIIGIVAWFLVSPYIATWLIVERPLPRADAIIVLSGSATYIERAQKAAELYNQGVAPLIFISNDGEWSGWSQSEQKNLAFVELERRELISGGVPPEAVKILPIEGSGTDWEAKAVGAEMDARPIGSLLIVTSPYHTRRALRTFDLILAGRGLEIGIEHTPIKASTPLPDFWWLRAKGLETIGSEYVKYLVYWAYY